MEKKSRVLLQVGVEKLIQMQEQLCKDDNKKVVVQMGGTLLLAIGSSILSSLLLAPNLLLFPFRHKKQQQHNDDNKLWRLPHHPFLRQFQTNKQQQQPTQSQHNIVGRIVSALVASFLSSSSAPNLLSQLLLLPHHRRRIQRHKHNDNSPRQIIKIVVVDQEPRQLAKTCLLEIAQGEDTLHTINYGPRGIIPFVTCYGMFLSKTHQNPLRLAIWNPTIDKKVNNNKKLMTDIPQSSVPRSPGVKHEYVRTYGFGFDPSSNDYKVIRFLHFVFEDGTDSKTCRDWPVELYSFKTNSWKQIAYPHGATACELGEMCVCINGFFYAKSNGARLFFIPFDLANDSFPPTLIPGPPHTSRRSKLAPLVFEGSQLAVIAYQHKPFEFELWVWNNNNSDDDDESHWSLRGEWANIGDPDIGYSPRGYFVNDGVVFLQNHCVGHDELVLFDCAKQTLKLLGVYHDPFLYVFPHNVENESDISSSLPITKKHAGSFFHKFVSLLTAANHAPFGSCLRPSSLF